MKVERLVELSYILSRYFSFLDSVSKDFFYFMSITLILKYTPTLDNCLKFIYFMLLADEHESNDNLLLKNKVK
jgi:putative flippase GtrA